MKRKIIFILLITTSITINLMSQNLAGVYKTKEDYVADRLSDVVDLNSDGNGFRENHSMVVVLTQGKKKNKYFYGEAYGYLFNGDKYRAVPKPKKFLSHYGYARIVENRGLIIYSKKSSGYKMTHTDYYYSLSETEPMKPLKRKNLLNDFASYPEFVAKINLLPHERSLYERDREGKYLLNNLICETIQRNCFSK